MPTEERMILAADETKLSHSEIKNSLNPKDRILQLPLQILCNFIPDNIHIFRCFFPTLILFPWTLKIVTWISWLMNMDC